MLVPMWVLLLAILLNVDKAFPSEEESSIGKELTVREGRESFEFDVASCGLSKGCLMKPANCVPHKDCVYAMSYMADEERVYFELLGQVPDERNSYVALGFSIDGLMGGDTVTDCSSFEGGPFSARLSYNPGKSNRKVPLEADMEAQILSTDSAHFMDGLLYCRFSQLIRPPSSIQPQFVRALNSPIFILISSGHTRQKELTIHSLNADSPLFPFSSATPVLLTEYEPATLGWDQSSSTPSANSTSSPSPPIKNTISESGSTQKSTGEGSSSSSVDKMAQSNVDGEELALAQQKAHGVLMLISWLLLAPFAILSARFLHHEKIELLGLHLWFQIHRGVNSLVFVLVLASLLCILAATNADWIGPSLNSSYEYNLSARALHALFGSAAILLTICQPLNALFRCSPKSPARFIFGWLHAILGYLAWLFSAISLSIACLFFTNKFLDRFVARDLLIASLALILVSFSVLQWFSMRRKRQLKESRRLGLTGEEDGCATIGGTAGLARDGQKENLLIRRAILGLFLALAFILCLALSTLLILG